MSYSQQEFDLAIDTIFERYDTNRTGGLEYQEVLKLVNDCLRHMGYRFRLGIEDVIEYMGSSSMGEGGKIDRAMLEEIFKKVLM